MVALSSLSLAKYLLYVGQLLLDRRINEVKDLIGSGIVDESKTIGERLAVMYS